MKWFIEERYGRIGYEIESYSLEEFDNFFNRVQGDADCELLTESVESFTISDIDVEIFQINLFYRSCKIFQKNQMDVYLTELRNFNQGMETRIPG